MCKNYPPGCCDGNSTLPDGSSLGESEDPALFMESWQGPSWHYQLHQLQPLAWGQLRHQRLLLSLSEDVAQPHLHPLSRLCRFILPQPSSSLLPHLPQNLKPPSLPQSLRSLLRCHLLATWHNIEAVQRRHSWKKFTLFTLRQMK